MRHGRGFTLLELLVVLSIVALATAGATLALRDEQATQLEREALRLSAMLESARAQSRTTGIPVIWRTSQDGFEFVGVRPRKEDAPRPSGELWGPRGWLDPDTRAQIVTPAGAQTLVLGPEPLIAAQRLVLMQGQRRLTLATDGLAPFSVTSEPVTP
jgi:general secretion pathway protein H